MKYYIVKGQWNRVEVDFKSVSQSPEHNLMVSRMSDRYVYYNDAAYKTQGHNKVQPLVKLKII